MKKASFEFESIVKLILALIAILIIIGLVYFFKDKSLSSVGNFFDFLRFSD